MADRRLPTILVGTLVLAVLAFMAAGLFVEDSLPGRLLRGGGLRPEPRQPTLGQAVVDGDAGDWVLAQDAFADVYHAGQSHQKVEAKLYLRYDCRRSLMYALLLSNGDWPIVLRRSQVRLNLDSANDEVPLVDFAWMEPGYDGNSQHTRGWEASFATPQGEHLLWATALVADEGEVQEASTPRDGLVLSLACDQPTTIFLNRLEAVPVGGRIRLEWETAWEVNNRGFHVYHGRGADGPWRRLNQELIPSRAAREGAVRVQYEFVHAGVDLEAENYYLLEDVAADGVATRHGPVVP